MSTKSEVASKLDEWLDTIPGRICFTESLKIFAPTGYGKCEQAVEDLVQELSTFLGGATVYEHSRGCWVDPNKRLECEPIKVIEIGHQCNDPEDLRRLSTAIVRYASRAKQQAISVKNGKFYIAESKALLERWMLESLKEEEPG